MGCTLTQLSVGKSGPGGRSYRPDLEGIRAIALAIILATHLVEFPTGGYVALDTFFVISGYLITGLLVREYTRTRTISLAAFYGRRTRRLAPAAMLTIAVTVVVGFLLFGQSRAVSILWDGIWASALTANWNFIVNGTDYFATWAPQSPLLHFWSLAVEEQFYLVWPLLLLLGFAWYRSVARRSGRSTWPPSPRFAIGLVAAVAVCSFAWGIVQANIDPAVSYLSTLTRAWELALGALLFFSTAWWKRIPAALRTPLSWTGVAVIVFTAFVYTPQIPYPGVAALAPTLATAAIIVAGIGGEPRNILITNPVSRFFGRISYSAYLWHWPVFVYVAAVVGHDSPWYLWGAIPLSLLLAVGSYYLVEDPIRRTKWLEPRPRPSGIRPAVSVKGWAAVGLMAASVIAVAAVVVFPRSAVEARPAASAPSATTIPVIPDESSLDTIKNALGQASVATSWPAPVADVIDSGRIAFGGRWSDTCISVNADNEDDCIIGDPSLEKTAVFAGDSVALAWVPALVNTLNNAGYRVHLLTRGLCPFADVSVTGTLTSQAAPGYPDACNDHRRWAQERIAALKPSLLITADAEAELLQVVPVEGKTTEQQWTEGLRSSIDAAAAEQTIVLMSPPRGKAVSTCYTRLSVPGDCTEGVADNWFALFDASVDATDGVERTTVIDTRDLFCVSAEVCPAFAGDTLIRADEQHITNDYATLIAPVVTARVMNVLGK